MECRKCHRTLPLQDGPGRRRTMCYDCSPKDRRDRRVKSIIELPTGPLSPAASVAESCSSRLEAADRLSSPLGAQAMMLARLLDAGGHTAAGFASLSRELRATMDEALKGGAREADAVDELQERRRRKTGA